ncbi:uncharacterized protein B0P05DRAFT_555409 [Gilbertella persicaria]|uniref:uncharacterized protein n=1 Tax=Gilbertella persicaria TaxID=101096 RepID=UPI00221E876D|nr:uncharacterized protein B0P05DRAFT_555409 [Gilbertella persicaria]KAI8063716.1 hypothetical protein B0P05DRAFT_555409 [Gilbertella persicaria]
MADKPKRSTSYQRLVAKLKRNPSERIDPKDWPKPDTPKEVIQHAIKGASRAFLLAYGVRASVNFCLYLIRVLRKRAPWAHIFEASFANLDSIRFGAMFGSFAFLWKSINNGMRVYRGKDDRLNGLVGGAVAGLSILFEKKERRVDIAQQLLVRALQAIYNAGKARDIFYFENGDALLFAVTCAQVLYAYTMRPETLPPDFYAFMVKTARCPKGALLLNEKNVRGIPIATTEALDMIRKLRPTKHAVEVVSQLPANLPAIPCEMLHPWINGCQMTAVERFAKVFKSLLPVYGTLHFVPMFLLRTQHFKRDPMSMLSKTTLATLKSGAFLASFVTLYQYQICMHRQLLKTGLIGSWNSKYIYYLAGFFCAYPSIFLEDKKRRSELALYVLPKAIQSFYHIAYSHHWIFKIKHFEVMMTSFAMGIIMSFYQEEADVLSAFVRKIMYQFFQKN